MKNLIAPLIILSGLTACSVSTERNAADEILETDRAFSAMSASKGMAAAFVEYAAESAIKLNTNEYPVIGRDALSGYFSSTPSSSVTLTWEPLLAEADGKLGVTFGDWKLTVTRHGRDTTTYGNYISVWKKQPDGKWKYILDGGNATPGPTPRALLDSLRTE